MHYSAEMLRLLVQLDVAGVQRLWGYLAPEVPQPDDREALVSLHIARTLCARLELQLRAYSHRWLVDHGYPSQLPDELRPRAERIYPQTVTGVGIAAVARSPLLRPAVPLIQSAMEAAVADAYAAGRTEPAFLRSRMAEAREKTIKDLFGRRP